jgi:IS30 family transposase
VPGPRLSMDDRRMIECGARAGLPQKKIAELIGRDPSVVCRELQRAGCPGDGGWLPARELPGRRRQCGQPMRYVAARADRQARVRGRRPKPCKLSSPVLAAVVSGWLALDWSPQQVSTRLRREFGDDDAMTVSHETIYRSLFVQGRGQLRRDLAEHLRTGRTSRKTRGQARTGGRLVGMVPISERPVEAADRAVPGHWEGDLLCGGKGKGAVITLVERRSRFVLLAPVTSLNALDVRLQLTELIGRLPQMLRRSLTWDQGKEMAEHAQLSLDTGMQVYFCHPHSPWQRGSNENTNGLLRQYWPKGCDMREITQDQCDRIAVLLNGRPRQTLDWDTPAEVFNQTLIATAA